MVDLYDYPVRYLNWLSTKVSSGASSPFAGSRSSIQNLSAYLGQLKHLLNLWLIRLGGLFGPFELDFEPLGTDLESVHGCDRLLSRIGIVERYEPETFGQVGLFVDEHLG